MDESARVRDQITLVVQVNGKLRGRIELSPDSDEEQAMAAATAEQNVQRHLEGKQVRKVIYIPNRLLNIVVG
jgi:leucyl-tRNA synthetase